VQAGRRNDVTFETLPVVHLDRSILPEYPDAEADDVLTALARRFGRIVIVDVQGVRRNDADLEFYQQAGKRRELWVDAGSRFATDAMDLFIAGAVQVTMRWNTLARPNEFEEAAEVAQPGNLFLGLEYPHGEFLRHRKDNRSAAEVVAWAHELGAGVVHILHEPDAAAARALPVGGERWLMGAPLRLAADLQAMGFAGLGVPAVHVPAEEPA